MVKPASQMNPKLLVEWNYSKNDGLLPETIAQQSNKKVWWQCKQGHEWQASPSNRSKGRGCPYCAGVKVLSGFNDLATKSPEVAAID